METEVKKLSINIEEEKNKALEDIKKQGLRVLVCNGTGCIANGSNEVIEKFRELGADVSILSEHDKVTIAAFANKVYLSSFLILTLHMLKLNPMMLKKL